VERRELGRNQQALPGLEGCERTSAGKSLILYGADTQVRKSPGEQPGLFSFVAQMAPNLEDFPYSPGPEIRISLNAHPTQLKPDKGVFSSMRKLAVALLLGLGLILLGCGNDKNSGNINGNWTATLTDGSGGQVFAFTTALAATGSSGTLTVNNFHFSTNTPCFVSGETESGTFALSGDFNGNVSGQFGMSVLSGSPGGNTLTLTGTVSGNTISGTWILAGSSGCGGNGKFTMTRM
jgi:hypothetical protein